MEDDYKSWEDLLDGEETDVAGELAEADLGYLKSQVDIPDNVASLFEKQKQLETHLKKLTGQGDPDPAQARLELMYPIKVHTKETRIAERKERKETEKQHFLKIKSLERKIAEQKATAINHEKRAETLRRLNLKNQIHENWEIKKKEQEKARLVKASEDARLQEKFELNRAEALSEKQKQRDQQQSYSGQLDLRNEENKEKLLNQNLEAHKINTAQDEKNEQKKANDSSLRFSKKKKERTGKKITHLKPRPPKKENVAVSFIESQKPKKEKTVDEVSGKEKSLKQITTENRKNEITQEQKQRKETARKQLQPAQQVNRKSEEELRQAKDAQKKQAQTRRVEEKRKQEREEMLAFERKQESLRWKRIHQRRNEKDMMV